jgi:hypothetical protein
MDAKARRDYIVVHLMAHTLLLAALCSVATFDTVSTLYNDYFMLSGAAFACNRTLAFCNREARR